MTRSLSSSLPTLALWTLVAGLASTAGAADPPCRPCAGIVTDDVPAVIEALASGPAIEGEQRLYVAWAVALDGSADETLAAKVRAVGGTPWTTLDLRTPFPVADHLDQLTREVQEIARIARASGDRAHFQLRWSPTDTHLVDPTDFAFVVKRAAVAITGANPDARVIVGPLPPAPQWIRAFYDEGVAAYTEGIALSPLEPDAWPATLDTLSELDPGKPVVVQRAGPTEAGRALATAADDSSRGLALTLFELPATAEALSPLRLLAREFSGDLSLDPTSAPSGPGRSWSFVRGEDLGLRVIAESDGSSQLSLFFRDAQLKSPERIDPMSGDASPIFGQSRTGSGLLVPIENPRAVEVLRLARMSAAELEGIEEQVLVSSERQLPVEEILRRLQAFEDDQARRLESYRAKNRMSLRFRVGNGANAVDIAFEGDFFFRQDKGFDWAWRDLYFNGVRWTGKKLPELPLIQPEKAAALPLEIHLSKQYRYRLRGTGEESGRDCWIVDFEPVGLAEEGETLWQGTVWIDRETSARVKTRALQLGLEGDVLSNEETLEFSPVDANGQPAEWSRGAFILPLRTTGQQLLSVLNSTTLVEREVLLTNVRINPENFEAERQALLDSDVTMVRDTDRGLRYLVKGEDGKRIVKEEFDTDRLAMAGGFFYDDSTEFPVPLLGINYFSLDWRGTGKQLNFLFAGPLLVANLAEPNLFGSRWDAGMSAFGFFLPLEDELYRDGAVAPAETVESARTRLAFFLGHPLGNYGKFDLTAAVGFRAYDSASDTDEEFVVPGDTTTLSLSPELTYTRSGWRFRAGGGWFQRSGWDFWGLPGNTDFDPEQEDYLRWQASIAKTWWLPKFTRLGLELEMLDGQDLDRFSKYDFGTFGDADVSGYQGGLVRAEEAAGIHLNYGLNLGDVIQVEVEADAMWATDEATGLQDELLAGVGLEGTVIGPWETIINFEVGHAVDGPGDGYSARVVFLKLFPEDFKLFKRRGKNKKKADD